MPNPGVTEARSQTFSSPWAHGDAIYCLDEDGTILVGKAARERLQTHPDKTAAVFKRFMGSERMIRLGKRDYRAEELSALVLRSLKEDAEAELGQPITEAVITVPAYFSDAQRKATRAAGVLAGLNLPSTAALARAISIPVIASGGLAGLADIASLLQPEYRIIAGAIAGRALYDGRLDAKAALALIADAK